jgi:hypothetical protein
MRHKLDMAPDEVHQAVIDSVTHARNFVTFDEDTIELRNVYLYKFPGLG